ncbi:hypothetical protein [Stenotrophomonas maltophilia]|uniref:hypothetical protein n=1 Tax=Stenotrophomonas maltophilia TaxID=40324 RepID=UPI0021C9ED74|nr:hypothetical protein [Stenotrophomonas maltophilia]MCU1068783.1 hypothetical protein [Stenotrophomonas maltophilia]MCU1075262.1 hypothetical protein [Stenotrophomonas maltophilia]MCU1140892.1 hypothetical protein [Stenotrophomonas maltophilia]
MNRNDPLTPEERELARLLGRRVEQAPPAALDATILAAARAAVDAPAAEAVASPDAPRTQRTRPRWPAVFGIAASMVFAIGIAWQLRPEPPPVPAGESAVAAAPATADVAAADPAAGSSAADSAVAAAEAAAAPAAPEAAPVAPAPAPSVARTPRPAPAEAAAAPPSTAPSAARSRVAEVAADTSFAALPPAPAAAPPAPPAPAAYSAPAPALAPAPAGALKARTAEPPVANAAEAERAQAMDRIEITSMKRQAPSRSAPGVMRRGADAGLSADAVQAEVDTDAQLPRRQWLQKIRTRRDDGQRDLARASLERYVQQYPEARLPRDLRPLLDD